MSTQLAELEAQLVDVEALLEASPEDESLLQLKSDLLELVAMTQTEGEDGQDDNGDDDNDDDNKAEAEPAQETTIAGIPAESETAVVADENDRNEQEEEEDEEETAAATTKTTIETNENDERPTMDTTETTHAMPFSTDAAKPSLTKKKKLKKVKDFEIPTHLQAVEGDSEAERNKKRRAVKRLKNEWRAKKKEFESEKKQQSWQNFNKKKKRKDKSIFATAEGAKGKVGVVSGGSMTEFGARKRHKF